MADSTWSAPKTDVLESARDLLQSDREGVLATIVDVEGSAYRRPGAKMVVPRDGEGIGSITAGCLEDEVLELAADVLADGHPRIETFDLMGDDDVWGLGVGCNGIIDLLLEPINEGYRAALDAYETGKNVAVVTVLSSADPAVEQWDRAYLFADGPDAAGAVDAGASDLPDWLEGMLSDRVAELRDQGKAATFTVDGQNGPVEVFVDGLAPPPELVVFGTGHDIDPIVEVAKRNDFGVTVVGFRGGTATEERFSAADRVVSLSPRDLRDRLAFNAETYVVVATHNFVDDRLALDEVVQTDVEYVGLMGPHNRFEEMLEKFDEEGRNFSDGELQKVYTPIGLDLGGGSPYQIATSIVAEVLAVHNGREPCHLSERSGPIHDRMNSDLA